MCAGAAASQKAHSAFLRPAMRADVALSASYWCLISAYVLPFIIASNNVIMFGHLTVEYNMFFNLSIALCKYYRAGTVLAGGEALSSAPEPRENTGSSPASLSG